ncbi:MAG: hypothetical protein LBR65_09715 [Culturomica sp.]|nr:hypothetical protein [Culturomica sp.]
MGIKTYETQHGSLTRETFGFSYPDFITGKSHIIVPDYYLTMGKFWNDQLHNPTTFASVGNDYYADKMENIPEDGSILIVSSQLHVEQLASLAVELAKQYPSLTIIYKTRPSESFCHERLQQLFLPYSTIRLINNEVDIKTLLHRSTLAVMIYSTVFFEALHFGTKIAIYKACDYKHLSDYFSLPNVYLFESIRELHAIYLKEKVVSNISVYEKFDRHAFESLISRE